MPQPLHADRPIDPSALTDAQRVALAAALYRVHSRIFDGIDQAAFARYVVDSPAQRTRIQVFRDQTGAVVGYAAFHVFSVLLGGQDAAVLRIEMGTLPAFRGQSLGWKMIIWEVLRLLLTRPREARYFVASPVHPASYYGLTRVVPYLHPRPEPTPPAMAAVLAQLDGPLGMVRPEGAGPHVRTVGWITRQTAAEADYWASHGSPLVRFFLTENPDYARGEGLRIACPLGLRCFVVSTASVAIQQLRRVLRTARRPAPRAARGES